jgi:hypothetical protein
MYPVVIAVLAGVVIFCVMIAAFHLMRRPRAPRAPATPIVDRRQTTRIPITSEIDVYWQDIDASHKAVRTKGIEMSEGGASVRSPKPILCNSVVYLRGRQINFEGPAVVRRCTKKGFQYIIAVELQTPFTKTIGLGA